MQWVMVIIRVECRQVRQTVVETALNAHRRNRYCGAQECGVCRRLAKAAGHEKKCSRHGWISVIAVGSIPVAAGARMGMPPRSGSSADVRLNDPLTTGDGHRLGATASAELGEDVRHVHTGRLGA